ncbi:hypothetical protein BC834DRAFT_845599 [Gloeopeniophorella convolvens]|nr:hypothetical protein BC834DRAFT_845599 [Gloeopeniophorella convolvens]
MLYNLTKSLRKSMSVKARSSNLINNTSGVGPDLGVPFTSWATDQQDWGGHPSHARRHAHDFLGYHEHSHTLRLEHGAARWEAWGHCCVDGGHHDRQWYFGCLRMALRGETVTTSQATIHVGHGYNNEQWSNLREVLKVTWIAARAPLSEALMLCDLGAAWAYGT